MRRWIVYQIKSKQFCNTFICYRFMYRVYYQLFIQYSKVHTVTRKIWDHRKQRSEIHRKRTTTTKNKQNLKGVGAVSLDGQMADGYGLPNTCKHFRLFDNVHTCNYEWPEILLDFSTTQFGKSMLRWCKWSLPNIILKVAPSGHGKNIYLFLEKTTQMAMVVFCHSGIEAVEALEI